MKRTKELHKNRDKRFIQGFVLCLISIIIATGGINSDCYTANATTYKLYNHVTMDSYTYSGTAVKYTINGKVLTTDYPGLILENGAAVGPYKEIFEKSLGVTSDYVEGKNSFSIFYGPHTIK